MDITSLESLKKIYPEEHDIELAIKYVLQYCNENRPYSYNDYMERIFNRSLDDVLKAHWERHSHPVKHWDADLQTYVTEDEGKHGRKK